MDERRRARILKQHVRTDQLLGVEAVPRREPSAEPHADASPASSAGLLHQADGDAVHAAQAASSVPLILDDAPAPAMLSREEKIRLLQAIEEQEVRTCTRCGLCHGRTNTVFGEGDPDAPVMFIGEGPGQNEDEQGQPFVGRAGELLTKMITAMGFQRQEVYISNVVKCRPPNNRAPTPEEAATCWSYLQRQIQIIRPRVIVTLGGPAAKTLLDTREGITRLRGTWHQYAGIQPPIPVMPTFHPAYLLRAYTHENRSRVWSDLQAVMARLKS